MKPLSNFIAIMLVSITAYADPASTDGFFSGMMDKEEYMVPLLDLPKESETITGSEIAIKVKESIVNSFITILDVEEPRSYRGKTVTKASCLVLDKPCWAYLILDDMGQWEVVSLTTVK